MMLRTLLSATAFMAIAACGVAAEQAQTQPAATPAAATAPAATTEPAPAAEAAAAAATPEAAATPAASEEEEIKFFDRGRLPRCPGDPRCPATNAATRGAPATTPSASGAPQN